MTIQQNNIEKLVPGLSAAENKQHYLNNITEEFPYYSAAHLAFIREHSPNDLSIDLAKQRAALVWHPLMLEQILLGVTECEEDEEVTEAPTMKAIPASEEIADEKIEQKDIEPEEDIINTAAQTGSIMDLAAAYEDKPAANQEEESSEWDEREKFEDSLAEEMNEEENEVELEIKNHQEIAAPDNNGTIEVKEEMIFEPLHTSDYFASQGIKLSEEQIPADKLGKQLKSFTEWLQTMKSVHPVNIDLKVNVNQEVATLAEKSNLEKEVLTESMAIAYIAQGKPQKAADIYEKLKLIYPHKSAYFAAELMKLS